MLRFFVPFVSLLAFLLLSPTKVGGGCDPNGLLLNGPAKVGGGYDPNGFNPPPHEPPPALNDVGGGVDPDGAP